jgi:hypothetical protein
VEQSFARSLFDTRCLLAGHVDRADILGLQKAFAVHSRGAQNFVLTDPNGDVSVVGRSESFVVKASSDFADVLFDFVRVHGFLDRRLLNGLLVK